MSELAVAALQSDIVWEDPAANFERLAPKIAGAAGAGARLIVLPEMFACGFSMSTERIAEPVDGPSTRFLGEQAERHGVWIGGSVPELPARSGVGAKPRNAFVLAGPGGERYRYFKIHPFTYAGEHEHYQAGDAFTTVEVDGVRLTLFICYDLRFADEFWATAADTDAYLVVANWPEARRHHWKNLVVTRAIENQAYVVAVNRVGRGGRLHYTGDSHIVDPQGEVLASAAGQEAVLTATLRSARVEETRGA
ncbi:MAG: nitrilase-related carbon-nitrogen hydrolase, partial [Acidobacteriota bacterium]